MIAIVIFPGWSCLLQYLSQEGRANHLQKTICFTLPLYIRKSE